MNYSRKVADPNIPMNPRHEPTSSGGEDAYYEEHYEELTDSTLHSGNLYTTREEFVPAADITSTKRSVEIADEKKEQRICNCSKGCLCFCLVILFAFLLAAAASIVLLFLEIETMKSNFAELNNSIGHEVIVQELQEAVAGHDAFVHNLSALQVQLNRSTDSLYQLFEQLTITSCADLPPSAPSGYYLIRSSSLHVYCDMSMTCGGVTGGWMRVFELDMTITSHQCPNGLSQRTDGGLRTCVRNVSAAGCSSIFLPTRNVNYSRVCGRITGYQIGTTDDFLYQPSTDIDFVYVDSVSLTHGLSPRQHIWTFAAAVRKSDCPCQLGHVPPSFVGNDYFCDSGTHEFPSTVTFFPDPLWNNANCLCCTNPPWFYQQLPQPTPDDIEMRVCRDWPSSNEDIAIQEVEIYVR